MPAPRTIAVLTASRAEYGLLSWVMREIGRADDFNLRTIVTGAHLAPAFGETWRQIADDGFDIDARIDMDLRGDDPASLARSTGLCVGGMGETLTRLNADLLVLLGDRYETLAAALAATLARVPIAHIAGGDITEGAFDDAIRHAITKLSHLHFVTSDLAAKRLRQLAEEPSRIHIVGTLSNDSVFGMRRASRRELEAFLDWSLRPRNLLITFHPVTLGDRPSADDYAQLLAAFEALDPDVGLIITAANADPEGMRLNAITESWRRGRDNVCFVSALGHERYLSLMSEVDAVVGNSSSGIYEAPILRKPTVNIGDRQAGRLRASSIIDVPPLRDDILIAITRAFTLDCSRVTSPYGVDPAAPRIIETIREIPNLQSLLHKRFTPA
jgi:UDP-hydrolysing UDP-N-acetyl-D-glucosamine 2-epimerase